MRPISAASAERRAPTIVRVRIGSVPMMNASRRSGNTLSQTISATAAVPTMAIVMNRSLWGHMNRSRLSGRVRAIAS